MKSLKLLLLMAVFGISNQALAGGGGGGGVLLASFSAQHDVLVYGLGSDSDSDSQLVAVAKFDQGQWTITEQVLSHSEVVHRPALREAILNSSLTNNWSSVSKVQDIQE